MIIVMIIYLLYLCLNSLQGPPTYINLPKPTLSDVKPGPSNRTFKCVRANQGQLKGLSSYTYF